MPTIDANAGAHAARPKSLSAASLLQRAGFGFLILVLGTMASVWLYDASIKASSGPTNVETRVAAPVIK